MVPSILRHLEQGQASPYSMEWDPFQTYLGKSHMSRENNSWSLLVNLSRAVTTRAKLGFIKIAQRPIIIRRNRISSMVLMSGMLRLITLVIILLTWGKWSEGHRAQLLVRIHQQTLSSGLQMHLRVPNSKKAILWMMEARETLWSITPPRNP